MTDKEIPSRKSAATLAEAIGIEAAELADVSRRQAGPAEEFLRGDTFFAVLEGPTLTVHLRDELAEAAARTPDAARSGRGSGWVALRPATLDVFALDRARSWFTSAWRYAGEPQGSDSQP